MTGIHKTRTGIGLGLVLAIACAVAVSLGAGGAGAAQEQAFALPRAQTLYMSGTQWSPYTRPQSREELGLRQRDRRPRLRDRRSATTR